MCMNSMMGTETRAGCYDSLHCASGKSRVPSKMPIIDFRHGHKMDDQETVIYGPGFRLLKTVEKATEYAVVVLRASDEIRTTSPCDICNCLSGRRCREDQVCILMANSHCGMIDRDPGPMRR